MIEKVYMENNGSAVFKCLKCGKFWPMKVSKYESLDRKVIIRCKCPCGHSQTVLLERRQWFRKATNLPGQYIQLVSGKKNNMGIMTVKDLSKDGLKAEINGNSTLIFNISDMLLLKFWLDDKRKSLIEKNAVIKNLKSNYICSKFCFQNDYDKAFGFYLTI